MQALSIGLFVCDGGSVSLHGAAAFYWQGLCRICPIISSVVFFCSRPAE
jgi:hypothetical protein